MKLGQVIKKGLGDKKEIFKALVNPVRNYNEILFLTR
jgi:hypothetical protein